MGPLFGEKGFKMGPIFGEKGFKMGPVFGEKGFKMGPIFAYFRSNSPESSSSTPNQRQCSSISGLRDATVDLLWFAFRPPLHRSYALHTE